MFLNHENYFIHVNNPWANRNCLLCNFENRLEASLRDIFVIGLLNHKIKKKLFIEATNNDFTECVNLTWDHVLEKNSLSNVNVMQFN